MENVMTAIGLMSGTSMDGIDLALVRTDGEAQAETLASAAYAYTPAERRLLEAAVAAAATLADRTARPDPLAAAEALVTERHGDLVCDFLARRRLAPAAVDVIGFHGQTVLHRPERRLTVQLGDGTALARRTGIAVVYDMRAADIAHGGQGAPLVPAYHAALAAGLAPGLRRYPVAFVNIGGISNVTWIPEHGPPLAFDSGPGNALIDQWVSRHAGVPFDQNGLIASEGGIDEARVEAYLAKPFFAKPGPKSLDRHDFGLDELGSLELADGARTLARVTAAAIAAAARHMPEPPRLWVVAGGGRRNPHIVADLQALAGQAGGRVVTAEEAGLDGGLTEAEAWAYLAVRSLRGLPLTFPATTGVDRPRTGGVLARP